MYALSRGQQERRERGVEGTDLSWFSSWVRSVFTAFAGGNVRVGGMFQDVSQMFWPLKRGEIIVRRYRCLQECEI